MVYDLLFTEPRLSLVIADPVRTAELVPRADRRAGGRATAALGASEPRRPTAARPGERLLCSRLATADSTALTRSSPVSCSAVPLARVWVTLDTTGRDRPLADTGTGPVPSSTVVTTLVRMPGDEPARWVRAHEPGPRRETDRSTGVIRVTMEAEGVVTGWLWGSLPPGGSGLDTVPTRLLSLAADQIALALRRDRLREDAVRVEVARRSDAFKSALLDSVSHDLRTPLASIRATAGNLADPASDLSPEQVRSAAEAIDAEVERLDRIVRSVLDLSRIGSGTLSPELEVHDLTALVDAAVDRARPVLGERSIHVSHPADPPLVLVDAVLLDTAIANLLDNIARHTPPATNVEVSVDRPPGDRVLLTIEDDGPGVAAADLDRIFDRFQRGPGAGAGARRGLGIGLSIVRGMSEAMGGTATAGQSRLGGLAVTLALPAAEPLGDDRA